jgi:dTDP-4-dehydrorhamnose 3,5-epimerase
MKLTKTKLDGVYIVEPQVFGDERGWFMETYSRIKTPEITCDFVQDNHHIQREKEYLEVFTFKMENMLKQSWYVVLEVLF